MVLPGQACGRIQIFAQPDKNALVTFQTILPDPALAAIVKAVLVFEEPEPDVQTVLPFFADGYPGLIFWECTAGLTARPHNKQTPPLFLYGQTIHPVELVARGPFRLIVCQLYPFVLRSFFGIEPTAITDNCYDLPASHAGAQHTLAALLAAESTESRIEILSRFLCGLLEAKREGLDYKVAQAINLLMHDGEPRSIADLCAELKIHPRTFERRFKREVGIGAKQFSSIIRFQQSLLHLTAREHARLTDVVYGQGYADQSHFIRVFKAFTKATPRAFLQA